MASRRAGDGGESGGWQAGGQARVEGGRRAMGVRVEGGRQVGNGGESGGWQAGGQWG